MRFQERLIRKSLQGIHCIPGKPSQLFYSLHTAALNPVISPKEHFFPPQPPSPTRSHIRQQAEAKSPLKSHCSHSNSTHPVLVLPQNSVFLGQPPLPLWRDLCTHWWPGLGSCRREGGRLVHGGRKDHPPDHRLRKKAAFRYHEPQRTSIPTSR